MFSSKYSTQHVFDHSKLAIHDAIGSILNGSAARVDLLSGIKVYKVKDIIRVDIKIEKEDLDK